VFKNTRWIQREFFPKRENVLEFIDEEINQKSLYVEKII
jgi:hypothetical protein